MTAPVASVLCLFCEDIRAERTGQDTIVGTIPDNLSVGQLPMPKAQPLLPKLGVYLRMNFHTSEPKPKDVSARVLNADGSVLNQTIWAADIIDKGFADAKANQMPLTGLLMKVVLSPIPISPGKITAYITVDGTDYLAGALNIIAVEAPGPSE